MLPPTPQTTGNNVGGGWRFWSSNPISMSGDEETNSTNNHASDGPLLEGRAYAVVAYDCDDGRCFCDWVKGLSIERR
jgi:hypothetical protein